MTNPLLNFKQTPHFESIKAEHVIPALEAILAESRANIAELQKIPSPDWKNFTYKMECLDERLSRVWSPVSHLNAIRDSEELRTAYQAGIDLLTAYHSEVGQNKELFGQYTKIRASEQWSKLTKAQKKLIENNLLDFKLGGAELSHHEQSRLTEIDQQLSQLSNEFERNLLDATQAWTLLIRDRDRLQGMPQSALDMAQQSAALEDQQGWLFTLQIPSYLAVMQHAQDRQLRQDMHQAYAQRASELSDDGRFDNTPLIDSILELKHARARLLGFSHFAQYSLIKKMASSSEAVIDFLTELAQHARPTAVEELADLEQFAADHYQQKDLKPWDISYYSERLREHQYAFSDEEIKPYFPAKQVFKGMFKIAKHLFGIEFQVNDSLQVWHPDVVCFDLVAHDNGQAIGSLYADLYVRKNKRGGAWMDSCIHRQRQEHALQKPVAFLNCNFTPPIGDDPALLSHNEVETLFHEFGHTLHHLLTEVDVMGVAGINGVAWDAVELPSQFFENWCWHPDSLQLIASHYKTGEPLPLQLLEKMRAAKNFQSGMQTLRQVEFGMFDMRLHSAEETPNVQALLDTVREEIAIIQAPAYNRFQNSFGHIFAGGYAAGYYSYKWSEVLSADAFERFEEEGIFNHKTGQDFLHSILQRGGVDDPNDLFIEFRGRPPQLRPLLRQSGL
ncbi:MAG: oligopeptidase A [Arenicella sp.]|jgi:oligopeptidase A